MKAPRIAIKRETLGEQQTERVQSNQLEVARRMNANPTNFGEVIGPVSFTAGQTLVMGHIRGREPAGFIAIDAQVAPWSGWRIASTDKTLTLYSDNAGTYKFLVF